MLSNIICVKTKVNWASVRSKWKIKVNCTLVSVCGSGLSTSALTWTQRMDMDGWMDGWTVDLFGKDENSNRTESNSDIYIAAVAD